MHQKSGQPLYKTITLKVETWKKIHKLRIDFSLKTLDDTVYLALAVLEIVGTIAKKYNQDVISFARDMVLWYDEYIKNKFKIKKGGL